MLNKIFEGGWFPGSKTYATTAIGIIGAVVGYLSGELTLVQALQLGLPLLGISFARGTVVNKSK